MISTILILTVISVLTASAAWGLWWAIRGGQFSNFQKGAMSIFDDAEPMGMQTDAFPDAKQTAGIADATVRGATKP